MNPFSFLNKRRSLHIVTTAVMLLFATTADAAAYFCFDDCIDEYGLIVEAGGNTYWYTSCLEFEMEGGAVGITCYYTTFVWN
jgi:hypothetical protein